MKKINILFSTLVFALVLLVVGAATVAPVMQAQTMSLQTASNANGELSGEVLFDASGRYAVSKSDLTTGKTFKFFGHDWRLVKVGDGVATFWMADPYAATSFNAIERSGMGIYNGGANIWTNGYSKTVWNSTNTANQDIILDQDGGSDIRKFLYQEAINMIDDETYANYKDKVVAGYVTGNNESNDEAKKTIEKLTFGEESLNHVEQDNTEDNQLTAYYDLDNSDRLWLPSYGDLKVWNVVSTDDLILKPSTIKWTDTTITDSVWLRTPNYKTSYTAMILSAYKYKTEGETNESYFHYRPVKQEAGVRPAIHLNIASIDEEYEDHINHPDGKKGFWEDDWLKVLFMTICILGIVGLCMVVVGVIVKVRRTRQTNEA